MGVRRPASNERSLNGAAAVVLAMAAIVLVGCSGSNTVGRDAGVVEPTERNLDEMQQDSVATDAGVEIAALGAVFSGTETLVRLRTTVVDEGALEAAGGQRGSARIGVASDGFSGPFAPGSAENAIPDDTLVVTLPPVDVDPDAYEGTMTFEITALSLWTPGEEVRVAGAWTLTLNGPAPSELESAQRLEQLGPAVLELGAYSLEIRGTRSTSSTEVEFTLPAVLESITQPALVADGQRYAPLRVEYDETIVAAMFPATAFGTVVEFEPGALITLGGTDSLTLTVDLGAALQRHPGGSSELGHFAIGQSDVTAGPADIVRRGERGVYWGTAGEQHWVAVEIDGNWRGRDVRSATEPDGTEYALAHVQTGYTTSDDGTVSAGETNIGFFVDDPSEVGEVTFVLGAASEVLGETQRVALQPR